jgi:uncharacterized membrane protein
MILCGAVRGTLHNYAHIINMSRLIRFKVKANFTFLFIFPCKTAIFIVQIIIIIIIMKFETVSFRLQRHSKAKENDVTNEIYSSQHAKG